MNRATEENIKAAKHFGLEDFSSEVFAEFRTLTAMFRGWGDFCAKHRDGFCTINGMILYTDLDVDVTYDDYCKFFFGKTAKELDDERKKEFEQIERDRRNFRRNIPKFYADFTSGRAEQLIEPEQRAKWGDCVRHCLEGMYGDLLIRSALDIIEWLRDGDEFEEVVKKSDVYGHSGYSWGQTRQIVEMFGGVRGKSFAEWERDRYKK